MNKLLLLLFSACLLPGCNNGGFKIDAPDGWTKNDTLVHGMRITLIKSPPEENDDFIENVNVITEETGGLPLDKYFEKNLAEMRSQLHGIKEEQQTDLTINGIDFKNIKYSHIYAGRAIDANLYVAVNGQTGYVITCTVAQGTLSKWQPTFDNIIRSFSFY